MTTTTEVVKKRFRVGLHGGDAAPAHFVTLGGICFPQYSGEYDENGHQKRERGNVVWLSREDIQRIETAAKARIVRWGHNEKGEKRGARIYQKDNALYQRAMAGDEPLLPYLFIEEEAVDIATPEGQAESLAALERTLADARESEAEARLDPRDARTRAEHAREKRGFKAPEVPPPPAATGK